MSCQLHACGSTRAARGAEGGRGPRAQQEFLSTVDERVTDIKEKMALLGEYWDPAARTFVQHPIPFPATGPPPRFDASLVGRGLQLHPSGRRLRAVSTETPGRRPAYALLEEPVSYPTPPPPSRTSWTRLVPPSVLTGHVSSLLPY